MTITLDAVPGPAVPLLPAPAAPLSMAHRLPRVRLAQREQFLVELCRGKRVVHVGFTDEGMRAAVQPTGGWLHARLAGSAAQLVGIDLEADGVAEARAQGYQAYVADCCDPAALKQLGLPPADVVIAGEIIEHVHAAGPFLTGLHTLLAPHGTLAVTTPNATRLNQLFATAAGLELNHPDHVQIFSWYTLTNLLGRHGWAVQEFRTYMTPRYGSPGWKWGLVDRVQRIAAHTVSPFFADGLIAVCRTTTAGRPPR